MSLDLNTLLTSDRRFIKRGTSMQKISLALSDLISDSEIAAKANESITSLKHLAHFLNLLQYASSKNDSMNFASISKDQVIEILKSGASGLDYDDVDDADLKAELGKDYISYKDIVIEEPVQASQMSPEAFLQKAQAKVTPVKPKPASKSSKTVDSFDTEDEDFWIHSVDLDFPMFPQCDSSALAHEFATEHNKYCIYGDGVTPWTQSQISCTTDVNAFSDQDILRLFPKIRLYTRSPYMYQQYENLEFDEDLGVIFPIKGYTKKQIRKNIIEYPHIVGFDRIVKIRGREQLMPFWKHIEIDGEIKSTASVWDDLPDTKKLPRTESFMNEYVVRKYILDSTVKNVEHKYPMRGTVGSFLTLYAPPSYYEELGYDPIEIGRQCVRSRQSYKYTRNPVVKMIQDAEMSV